MTRRRVLVLGGGDVGSAVAHALFGRGDQVLLCDRSRSAHARRGMAFTDALFEGVARLDGFAARFCGSLSDIDECWESGDAIPICVQPEELLLREQGFDVLVDASMRRDPVRPDRRPWVACAIGLGPGYVPGRNCHVAVETQWGTEMGRVLADRATADRSGGPHELDGVGRERFVPAPASGIWETDAAIGQQVRAGEPIGRIGGEVVLAPLDGHLRGLSRNGVDVTLGQRIVEVDPRNRPQLFGRGERPAAIAGGVLQAIDGFGGVAS